MNLKKYKINDVAAIKNGLILSIFYSAALILTLLIGAGCSHIQLIIYYPHPTL